MNEVGERGGTGGGCMLLGEAVVWMWWGNEVSECGWWRDSGDVVGGMLWGKIGSECRWVRDLSRCVGWGDVFWGRWRVMWLGEVVGLELVGKGSV